VSENHIWNSFSSDALFFLHSIFLQGNHYFEVSRLSVNVEQAFHRLNASVATPWVFSQDLGFFLSDLEIRAVRRRHCVGGAAPVNFGRRKKIGGGAALAAKNIFF